MNTAARRIATAVALTVGAAALLGLAGLPPGYPSNDAGAYHRMVELWVQAGHPVFIGWNEMTLLGHLQTGVALAWAGFDSIEARQILVGLQAVAAAVLLLALGRRRDEDVGPAGLAALAWIASPLVLVSATSYMTEVPATLWILVTLAAFGGWCRRGHPALLLLTVGAAVAAFSVRQTAVVLVPALAVGAWGLPARRRRGVWGIAAATFALDAILWWWRSTLPSASVRSPLELLGSSGAAARLGSFVEHGVECAATVGLLLLPVAVAALPLSRRRLTRVSLPVAGAAALVLVITGSLYPFWGNLVTRRGLLPDVVPHAQTLPTVLAPAVCTVLTVLAVAGVAVLCGAVEWRRVTHTPTGRVAAVAAGALLVAVAAAASPFDRYCVPLTAVAALVVARGLARPSRAALWGAITLAAALAVASAGAVRELHARQLAIWDVAESLTRRGIPATAVDGGFEWNMAHQPVPFVGGRRAAAGGGRPWYYGYPFSGLEPTHRLWLGRAPEGWCVSERHAIPGRLVLKVLTRGDDSGAAGDPSPAHDLRTTLREDRRPARGSAEGSL